MGSAGLSGTPAQLAETFRAQAIGCEVLGSPLYAALCERFADEVERRGPIWDLLAEHADAPLGAAYPLRVLGGLHKLALRGDAPELASHFPSTGGDADVEGAWRCRALIAAPPPGLLDARPSAADERGRALGVAHRWLPRDRAGGPRADARARDRLQRRAQPALRPLPLRAGGARLRAARPRRCGSSTSVGGGRPPFDAP